MLDVLLKFLYEVGSTLRNTAGGYSCLLDVSYVIGYATQTRRWVVFFIFLA
ncbi:MAG: hypothetical protein ACI8ZB_004526 [Desulforhopalus sp.]|jgi:hypothetical protein